MILLHPTEGIERVRENFKTGILWARLGRRYIISANFPLVRTNHEALSSCKGTDKCFPEVCYSRGHK